MKSKNWIYSIVSLIGISCIAVSIGRITEALFFNGTDITSWHDGKPMAFSTACTIGCIGVALYLIGKNHIHHDKVGR